MSTFQTFLRVDLRADIHAVTYFEVCASASVCLVSVFFARRANETRILSKFTRICPNFSPPAASGGPGGGRTSPRVRGALGLSTNYNPGTYTLVHINSINTAVVGLDVEQRGNIQLIIIVPDS